MLYLFLIGEIERNGAPFIYNDTYLSFINFILLFIVYFFSPVLMEEKLESSSLRRLEKSVVIRIYSSCHMP